MEKSWFTCGMMKKIRNLNWEYPVGICIQVHWLTSMGLVPNCVTQLRRCNFRALLLDIIILISRENINSRVNWLYFLKAYYFIPTRVFRHCPEAVSQMRHRPSNDEETMRLPSRLKCTALTGSLWAGRVFRHFPVRTSQMRTLSSNEPLTTRLDWKIKNNF